jgi:hypothetical protein
MDMPIKIQYMGEEIMLGSTRRKTNSIVRKIVSNTGMSNQPVETVGK